MMGLEPWVYTGIKQQSNETLTRIAEIVKKADLEFTLGGLW
jgi:hypothetical protein